MQTHALLADSGAAGVTQRDGRQPVGPGVPAATTLGVAEAEAPGDDQPRQTHRRRNPMMEVALYARVSTNRQPQQQTIAHQFSRLRERVSHAIRLASGRGAYLPR